MKRKLISLLLTTTMATMMLVGCGDGSADADTSESAQSSEPAVESNENEEAAEGEEVVLTYWGWASNYVDPLFAAYEEVNPNVKFEIVAVEWGDMLSKVQQALATGSDLPVMIDMDNVLIENWKAMDVCTDVSVYGFDDSQYLESLAVKCQTEDGAVMGIQESINPSGIAYKRDLALEYFGTDDPKELEAMFSTYEDYARIGKEVYDKSNGEVYLFHSGQAVAEWLYFASDVANMEGDTILYTEKMTDVLSKLIMLRDSNAVDTYQNGTPEANATYASENHIFYPCPNWALTYYIQGNDPEGKGDWGLISAPIDYNHGGSAMGIIDSATDAQKQAAYDFMVWATAGEGAVVARDEVGFITPYLEYMNDTEWVGAGADMIEWFGGQDIGELYYQEIAPNMASVPSTLWDNTVISVRNDLSQLVVDDKSMTLDDAVALGYDQITQLVTDEAITIE